MGGGFAGLSAAVRLCELGHQPTLFERRPMLGGRAYSFEDQQTGDTLDNGQHVLMRCCTAVLGFLETIGASDVHFESGFSYPFATVTGKRHRLEAPKWLPPDLGLLVAFLKFGPTSWRDAVGLRRILPYFESPPGPITVNQWLDDTAQSDAIRSSFWHPLCLSVMNATPDVAGARELVAVLAEAFSRTGGANIGWSTVGLSDLYTDKAADYVESRGGQVVTNTFVDDISATREGFDIAIRGEQTRTFNAAILAVPPPRVKTLVEKLDPSLATTLDGYQPSPILGINLWFERDIMSEPILGLLGGTIEWVFDKRRIQGVEQGPLSLVVSASRHLLDKTDRELKEIALTDLRRAGLVNPAEEPYHTRIIHEKQATFIRPLTESSVTNGPHASGLFVAGDWTDTGFPPTIEGAVRSGAKAAELLNRELDPKKPEP